MPLKFYLLTAFVFFLLFLLPTAFAQSTNCGGGSLPRAEGLVTSPSLTGKFGTTGKCVTDSKVAFAPFKIPTYADLVSTYYNQSKLTKNTMSTFPDSFSQDGIYKTSGDLTAGGSLTGKGVEVIFVEGNLTINNSLIYHTNDGAGGLVFVVRDNVNIAPGVTRIDAVIISYGKIFTAGNNCSLATNTGTNSQLVINGSLISLDSTKTIEFCRKLVDNSQPAEKINYQVKYLVILRDLMSDTYQKWSEIP